MIVSSSGFIVWDDEYYPIFAKLLREGYEELFFEAPYYWAVVNLKTNSIYTLTEGDTTKTTYDTAQQLYDESKRQIDWLIENGETPAMYGEWGQVSERMEALL